jgi:hypothetical protein
MDKLTAKNAHLSIGKNVVDRSLLFVGLVQLNITRLHVHTMLV